VWANFDATIEGIAETHWHPWHEVVLRASPPHRDRFARDAGRYQPFSDRLRALLASSNHQPALPGGQIAFTLHFRKVDITLNIDTPNLRRMLQPKLTRAFSDLPESLAFRDAGGI
jgi:hypothetical protein